MKLEVKNIGLIREAEIELDGVTVLAGYNGTGKSTISKSLYAIMTGYADLPKKILKERTESIREILDSYLKQTGHHVLYYDLPVFTEIKNPESPLYYLPYAFATNKLSIPESYDAFCKQVPNYSDHQFDFNQFDAERARTLYPDISRRLRDAVSRPSEEYKKFILSKNLTIAFEGQSNTLSNTNPGDICLFKAGRKLFINIQKKKSLHALAV